jgi:phosphate starvation-inducible membrane PsiE
MQRATEAVKPQSFSRGTSACDHRRVEQGDKPEKAVAKAAHHEPSPAWIAAGARALGTAESAVLVLIGAVLVALALLMLWSSVVSLVEAAVAGRVHHDAINILDGVLLVMMTMEIVYTVAISLKSHSLVAEPFLIIGAIAAIRRMLVITATSTRDEHTAPEVFRNTLYELALLALIVLVMAIAIAIMRRTKAWEAQEAAARRARKHAE